MAVIERCSTPRSHCPPTMESCLDELLFVSQLRTEIQNVSCPNRPPFSRVFAKRPLRGCRLVSATVSPRFIVHTYESIPRSRPINDLELTLRELGSLHPPSCEYTCIMYIRKRRADSGGVAERLQLVTAALAFSLTPG